MGFDKGFRCFLMVLDGVLDGLDRVLGGDRGVRWFEMVLRFRALGSE